MAISDFFAMQEYRSAGNTRTVFLFGGWRSRPFWYYPLIASLKKNGANCILYVPHKKLIAIGTPYANIVDAARTARNDVARRIANSSPNHTFAAWGISFGTMFAMECARNCPRIARIALNAPFGDFAEHVKYWPNHPYFGKVLASQPTSRDESARILNQAGTTKELSAHRGKTFLISYAAADEVIHTPVTQKFITALSAYSSPSIIVAGRGHVYGILKTLIQDKRRYIAFLQGS